MCWFSRSLSELKSSVTLYENDFYAWTQEQALLLHNHQWSQLDLPNLIEEIESLGKQQREELAASSFKHLD